MHEIRILSLCWPTLLPAGNQHDATINETKKTTENGRCAKYQGSDLEKVAKYFVEKYTHANAQWKSTLTQWEWEGEWAEFNIQLDRLSTCTTLLNRPAATSDSKKLDTKKHTKNVN